MLDLVKVILVKCAIIIESKIYISNSSYAKSLKRYLWGERQNIMPCFDKMDDLNGEGGYSHAPDNLTYGVDMKHIRWCGILQVILIILFLLILIQRILVNKTLYKKIILVFVSLLENCSSIFGCSTSGDIFKKCTS